MPPHTFRSRTVGSERGHPQFAEDNSVRRQQSTGVQPESRVLGGSQVAVEGAVRTICKNPWWHTRSQRRPGTSDGVRASISAYCDHPAEVVMEGKTALPIKARWAGETKNTKGPKYECKVDDRPIDDPVREFKRGEYYNKTIDRLRYYEKQYDLHPTRDFGHMGHFERFGTISRDYGKNCYDGAKLTNIGCAKAWPWLKEYQLRGPRDPGHIQPFFGSR